MALTDTSDIAHAFQPVAQGTAGDSASPEAIRRLSRELASSDRAARLRRLTRGRQATLTQSVRIATLSYRA